MSNKTQRNGRKCKPFQVLEGAAIGYRTRKTHLSNT